MSNPPPPGSGDGGGNEHEGLLARLLAAHQALTAATSGADSDPAASEAAERHLHSLLSRMGGAGPLGMAASGGGGGSGSSGYARRRAMLTGLRAVGGTTCAFPRTAISSLKGGGMRWLRRWRRGADFDQQFSAVQELCEYLSMSNEETLSGFPVGEFVPPVRVAEGRGSRCTPTDTRA
jgi:hypothetical protein